jgi:hypothetical protein
VRGSCLLQDVERSSGDDFGWKAIRHEKRVFRMKNQL